MPAAPLPPDEAERLAALYRYHVLDTRSEAEFDDLTRIAAHVCGTSMALVTLLDGERQWFKSRVGVDLLETPRDQALCGYALLGQGVMQVPDTRADPRFADNPLVVGEPGFAFYAGTPLVDSDGHALGTLCVLDATPRTALSDAQTRTLAALGRQVVALLELRQVATRFAALSENATDCVYVLQLDPVLRVDYVSPAITWLTGLTPQELYADAGLLREVVHPDDHHLLDAVLAGSSTPDPFELRFVHRNGRASWTEHVVRTAPDGWPGSRVVQGAARDVTARREAQDELVAARERAEQARVAKDALVSRVSHELRTPLNAVLGFAQLLELELEGEQADSLQQIMRAARHLLAVVDEVLALRAHGVLAREEVALAALAQDAVGLLGPQAQDRRLALEVEQSLEGLRALGDRQQVAGILLNLLGNAVRYTGAGGCVRLSGGRDGEQVLLHVADTGPGLTAVDVERLFTPFERLDAEARGISGTGLGLALARSAAEQMQGALTVRSSPQEGSVFTLRLPAWPRPQGGDPATVILGE